MTPLPALLTTPIVRDRGCLRRHPVCEHSKSGGCQTPCASASDQVIIFVNRLSGGGRAGEYLEALGEDGRRHEIKLSKTTGQVVQLRAFDVRHGEPGKKAGFLLLKELATKAESPIRVMVAGGDGTVMWAISEMEHTGVNLENVVLGHIPFGTGNDFSRSTGWGPAAAPGHLIGRNRHRLKRDLKRWLAADIVNFDVWEVEVTSGGGFAFVHGGLKCLTETDKVQHGIEQLKDGRWRMKKRMVNYFSLGQCCRAGLGFEKKRTSSRLGNNLRYGFEGLKKLFLRPAPMVSDVVDELSVSGSHSSLASMAKSYSTESMASTMMDDLSEDSRPSSRDDSQGILTEDSSHSLPSGGRLAMNLEDDRHSAELLFLNIPSFAGGADPWGWSSSGQGHCEDISKCSQDVGDGRLEVVSYSSGLGAAVDAANGKLWTPGRGAGQRVASAEGPFRMSFKAPEKAKYTSADGRVYLQVDGEFFVANQPKEIQVRHCRTVKVAQQDKALARFGCLG